MSLGQYIRAVRLNRGLSQWELAALSGLGRSHISRLELDNYERPSAETFLSLAKGLKLNPSELYQAAGYTGVHKFRRGRTPEEALAQLEIITPTHVPIIAGLSEKESDVVQYASWGFSGNGEANLKGLRVQGFSLEPEIKEGDIIFFDAGKAPNHGNILLCYQDEQIRLVRHGPDGHIGEGCHVYGVVVGVNHSLA